MPHLYNQLSSNGTAFDSIHYMCNTELGLNYIVLTNCIELLVFMFVVNCSWSYIIRVQCNAVYHMHNDDDAVDFVV